LPAHHPVHNGPAEVVIIRGELDLATYPEVSRVLVEHLDRVDDTLQIDLSDVTFFAAAGVHMLLETAELARQRGITLRIGPLSRTVAMVVKTTGTRDQLGC
jgi:anti-anti-sigma factor